MIHGPYNVTTMWCWSEANPIELHVKPFYRYTVTIGFAISTFSVAGLYFFEDETGSVVTVTSDRYVEMVNEILFPELCCRYIDLASNWFQQMQQQYLLFGSR